ncbi:MAG TPA: ABC transporter ATP-binding protein [Geminicoccaceae bacterium]|nr:ABC transporter ATP-binding protein [Geminicoccaceae bacterium]
MAEPGASLEIAGLRAGYGATVVLEALDLRVAAGECVAVLGRNGVGKTTLVATIMGHTTVQAGTIRFDGLDIGSWRPHRRARAGLGWVPQEREIFPSLTVQDNLAVASRPGAWTTARAFEIFPRLEERAGHAGRALSGGEQQMLAIARALVGNPSVLLMDEPFEGLAPIVVEELTAVIARLRADEAMTMILVEQRTDIALDLAERAVVMDRGRVVFDDASARLRSDPELLHALVGVG